MGLIAVEVVGGVHSGRGEGVQVEVVVPKDVTGIGEGLQVEGYLFVHEKGEVAQLDEGGQLQTHKFSEKYR